MRQIVELRTLLGGEPLKALDLFEKIVGECDDDTILEASQCVSNYIRHSSIYKQRVLYEKLRKCSLLSRLYLSLQFNAFTDVSFPKKFIFDGSSLQEYDTRRTDEVPAHRHYVTAVGSNRFFNLGLLSDGSPVSEPHIVNLPRVTQIEMSNSHTIFVTKNNRIYGCGKASSFLPDRIEEHDGGYVALPTLINIPNIDVTKIVDSVRTTEGGTQILIEDEWYFIGKHPDNTAETRRISSNCSVSVKKHENLKKTKLQTANVSFDGKVVQVHVGIGYDFATRCIMWDRTTKFDAPKKLHFVINGFSRNLCCSRFDDFQVLSDGTIYAVSCGLLKGKLELWKNKDDGFKVKNGTVLEHFDTKYSLVAVVHEVPGTIGTKFFKVSPDGQNLIMKKGYDSSTQYDRNSLKSKKPHQFESVQIHRIMETRENQFDPVDIPKDLNLIFINSKTETKSRWLEKDTIYETEEWDYPKEEFQINRRLFEMIFPHYIEGIRENEEIYLYQKDMNCELFIDSDRPSTKSFVPPSSADQSSIWFFISIEKTKIPCHKNLILLHSRQITAMQRFNTNYGNFGAMELEEEKPVEIAMNVSADTIRNAINGMIDIRTLYEIKTLELIECINFYDYQLMEELFRDSMYILMDTITEYTLPFLYELFWSFENNVIEGIATRPEIFWSSISAIHPPKEFLLKFAKKLEHRYKNVSYKHVDTDELSSYDPSYVIRSLVNLDEDLEDVVWNSLRKSLDDPLTFWYSDAMKKKEEKRAERNRRNSHTCRQDSISMTSSPIPIGGHPKTESFSKSLNSPVARSPLTQSMSPLGKALPILKPRNDSISNSFEDFPEVGFTLSTPKSSSGISPGGRFAPKGTKFKKDFEILKPATPTNPWKSMSPSTSSIREEIQVKQVVNFDEVVRKEEKLQKNIRTGFKKVQLLPHVELEELAVAQILEVFGQELHNEAIINVELVNDDNFDVENEQNVWGNMPGLVRR
ncbi:hypothetical protein GCK72_001340 [Caenorhabditis remanei]|uniref:Uncharacterized protein n=1 Tax=Caenorhabditis remanei TaxID=31234 RepID=A0A6A5HTF9_CAERE|nr:hypothetical protein GCK72_001340 [Caenorhabditis remanei]KAF1769523.1 hypothetical protein GCK72_001340 [Caenorhabditis remanei]